MRGNANNPTRCACPTGVRFILATAVFWLACAGTVVLIEWSMK